MVSSPRYHSSDVFMMFWIDAEMKQSRNSLCPLIPACLGPHVFHGVKPTSRGVGMADGMETEEILGGPEMCGPAGPHEQLMVRRACSSHLIPFSSFSH